MSTIYVSTPQTVRDVQVWFDELLGAGCNFHPDDPLSELVDRKTGEPVFDRTEGAYLDALMDSAHKVCDREGVDIYLLGLDAFGV